MLYSDCAEDTADIIEQLRKKEASKGHKFPSPLEITDRERRVLPLYQVRFAVVYSCKSAAFPLFALEQMVCGPAT